MPWKIMYFKNLLVLKNETTSRLFSTLLLLRDYHLQLLWLLHLLVVQRKSHNIVKAVLVLTLGLKKIKGSVKMAFNKKRNEKPSLNFS